MAKEIDYQFVIMPMFIMKDKRLSNNDRVTYGIIRSYMWGHKDICNPSQEKIRKDFPVMALRTLRRSIQTLKEFGYFQIQRGGDGEANTYLLVEQSGQFGITEIQRGQNEHFSYATVASKTYNESDNNTLREEDTPPPHKSKLEVQDQTQSPPYQVVKAFFDLLKTSVPLTESEKGRYCQQAKNLLKSFDLDDIKDLMDWYFNPPDGDKDAFWRGSKSFGNFCTLAPNIARWYEQKNHKRRIA